MSSAWWLTWRCALGFGAHSKTPQNIIRTGECVLNLPSAEMVGAVNRLAFDNGLEPGSTFEGGSRLSIRAGKIRAIAGLTPIQSETVEAPRVLECPVQMEATLESVHHLAEQDGAWRGRLVSIEMRIHRVHVSDSILADGDCNRIDPDKWRPLIMSFQHFYGLTAGQAERIGTRADSRVTLPRILVSREVS